MRIKIEVTQEELDEFEIHDDFFPKFVIEALDNYMDLPAFNVYVEIVDEKVL